MAEAEQNNTQDNREFSLQRVYLKDSSFETPMGPEAFKTEWKPEVNMNLTTKTTPAGDDFYETVLTITVSAKLNDKTAFLIEIQQAGIFAVKNFPKEEMDPMFGIYCPNVLYPYAREVISDLVSKGSFPQLLLAPVNFEGLYQQNLQARQQKAN